LKFQNPPQPEKPKTYSEKKLNDMTLKEIKELFDKQGFNRSYLKLKKNYIKRFLELQEKQETPIKIKKPILRDPVLVDIDFNQMVTETTLNNPILLAEMIITHKGIVSGNEKILPFTVIINRNLIDATLQQIIQNFKGTIEEKLALLWWITIFNVKTPLSKNQIQLLNNKTNFELLEILGSNYDGPTDRASMYFAIYSGLQPPIWIEPENFEKILTSSPADALRKAVYVDGFYGDENEFVPSILPLYRFLSIQGENILDKYINKFNGRNGKELSKSVGMIIPTKKDTDLYFLKNLRFYRNYLIREPTLPEPPTIKPTFQSLPSISILP
jgi:hypothetical protein